MTEMQDVVKAKSVVSVCSRPGAQGLSTKQKRLQNRRDWHNLGSSVARNSLCTSITPKIQNWENPQLGVVTTLYKTQVIKCYSH